MNCSVQECTLPVAKRNLCNRHYLRLRRHGDPLQGARLRGRNVGLCSVDGCDSKPLSLGLCAKHYQRQNKHGTLDGKGTPRGDAARFYHEVVRPYEGDDCLFWPYANVRGYAQVVIDGRTQLVTRLICSEANGPPPSDNMDAAHSCGKGSLGCVTKRHLSWKTRAGNMADAAAHGTIRRGEKASWSKLTEAQAREILALKGTASQREIAKLFPVNQQHISRIHNGTRWAHLVELEPIDLDEEEYSE